VDKTACLLCGAELTPLDDGNQEHPDTPDCEVRLTDAWGVAIQTPSPEPEEPGVIEIKTFPFVDEVLTEIFAKSGLPRLGGVSSG